LETKNGENRGQEREKSARTREREKSSFLRSLPVAITAATAFIQPSQLQGIKGKVQGSYPVSFGAGFAWRVEIQGREGQTKIAEKSSILRSLPVAITAATAFIKPSQLQGIKGKVQGTYPVSLGAGFTWTVEIQGREVRPARRKLEHL